MYRRRESFGRVTMAQIRSHGVRTLLIYCASGPLPSQRPSTAIGSPTHQPRELRAVDQGDRPRDATDEVARAAGEARGGEQHAARRLLVLEAAGEIARRGGVDEVVLPIALGLHVEAVEPERVEQDHGIDAAVAVAHRGEDVDHQVLEEVGAVRHGEDAIDERAGEIGLRPGRRRDSGNGGGSLGFRRRRQRGKVDAHGAGCRSAPP
jgi:hypothetical protein